MAAVISNPSAATAAEAKPTVAVKRRTVDAVLISLGVVAVVVLAVAGGMLMWGHNFANNYVHRELTSQQIFFPSTDALTTEGRTDLVGFAGQQVTTGKQAEAYASYINGHLQKIGGGKTFAELGAPFFAAQAEVTKAKAANAPADQVAKLQATVDGLAAQRSSLFQGETLRGLLLTSYAWATVGQIAYIAAIAAFVAAGIMLLLVVFGVFHLARAPKE